MRPLLLVSGLFLLLQACSSSNPDWVTTEDSQTIYLIGPVYIKGDEGSYKLSLELKKRIFTLLSNSGNSSIEIESRKIYLRKLDWNLYDTVLQEVWMKLKSELQTTESTVKSERIEKIIDAIPKISGKYLLFLKIAENPAGLVEVSGIRVIPPGKKGPKISEFRVTLGQYFNQRGKEIEQVLSSLREIPDPQMGPEISEFRVKFDQESVDLKKKIDRILVKLIISKSFSSPDLNRISFERFKEGCFVYSKRETDGENREIEKCVSEFYLNKYPVTQFQWNQILESGTNRIKRQENYPKVGISSVEIQTFLDRLNDLTSLKYRLPTEDEWEYACRLGRAENKTPENVNLFGVGDNDRWSGMSKVDESQSDQMGLHDMIGNVWEWTGSRYFNDREIGVLSRTYEKINDARQFTIKGGSFATGKDGANCGTRRGLSVKLGNNDIGFRLVLEP